MGVERSSRAVVVGRATTTLTLAPTLVTLRYSICGGAMGGRW